MCWSDRGTDRASLLPPICCVTINVDTGKGPADIDVGTGKVHAGASGGCRCAGAAKGLLGPGRCFQIAV